MSLEKRGRRGLSQLRQLVAEANAAAAKESSPRKPRLHTRCGRKHVPGACSLVRTSYGTLAPAEIAEQLEERWLEEFAPGVLDVAREAA